MSMTKNHRRTLDRTLEVLSDDLDLQPAITHLRSKEFFTEEHESRINAQSVHNKKVSEFVSILKKTGEEGYKAFRSFLLSCPRQSHIATELDQSLEEVESLPSDSPRTTQDDPWSFYDDQFYCFPCSNDTLQQYTGLPKTLRFLLIGKTGSGKSATGNTILGKNVFLESSRTESQTKTIRSEETKEGNEFIIRVIDTPGLFDTARDFSNSRLSLEIAKAVFSFKDGIHLFLLVCNPSVKFTREEEETIQHIEAVMRKDIFDFCALILTHAKGKFGEDGKESLEQYILEEKKARTKFSDLLYSVGNRVIAVENSFSEALLKKNHRQKLLASLAEVVEKNGGRVYRNRLFEKASFEIDKEYNTRQNRYEKKKNFFQMKLKVENCVYHMLPSLTEEQLRNLKQYLKENIREISEISGANSIPAIEEEHIEKCLKKFVECNSDIIDEYIDLNKLQTSKTRNELERQQQITKQENILKMKHFVVNVAGNFLRQCSKDQLKEIQKSFTLPDDQWAKIFSFLEREKIIVPEQEVRSYVQETFFESPDVFQKFIEERDTDDLIKEIKITIKEIEQITEEKQQYILAETLINKVPAFIKGLSHDNERKLSDALSNEDDKAINFMVDLFLKEQAKEEGPKGHDSMKAIIKLHFVENRDLILSCIKVFNDQRTKLLNIGMTAEENQRRMSILKSVSDVIDEHLKCYLAEKSVKELKKIGKQLRDDKVPRDILEIVLKDLFETKHQITDETMIEEEILTQLQNKIQIMEALAHESKSCFPSVSFVQTKSGKHKSISDLIVGDEILAFDSERNLKFEKVFLISHANKDETVTYVRIVTRQGKILLISPNHLLPIEIFNNNVPARQANVGQTIFTVQDGVIISDVIEEITYQKARGLFCPITIGGTIVVNGVAASCYTAFFNPSFSQTLLYPFKVMYHYLPTSVFNVFFPYDSKEGMPKMLSLCRSIIVTSRFVRDNICHFFQDI